MLRLASDYQSSASNRILMAETIDKVLRHCVIASLRQYSMAGSLSITPLQDENDVGTNGDASTE